MASEELKQWATPRQAEIIQAIIDNGSQRKAAAALGMCKSNVARVVDAAKRRAAAAGYSPEHNMVKTVPEGFHVKGVSTLYGQDGEVRQQWVKSNKDKTQRTLDALRGIVEDIAAPIHGAFKPIKAPRDSNADLMCVYPIADVHIGMYAWLEETGKDWDADLCADQIRESIGYLFKAAPNAETALIANLGDFFHTDTSENKTMRSGHQLDVDTRWARVFKIGVQVYRQMIEAALKKHKRVIVKSAIGNHDDHTGLSLAMIMQAYFEKEPRVEILLPINPFTYHQFGQTLIGINHGAIKPERLPGIMSCDKREEWGATRWHHWLTGHIHHKTFHEFPGCTVESFRTPSAKDNWTHSGGYRAERDMVMIKIHKKRGEIGRIIESIY